MLNWLFRRNTKNPRQIRPASIESLERRQLLAFSAKIDFQPEWVNTAVPGYHADIGRTFGDRGNGLTYGWNEPNESWARVRDFSNTKWATLNHMHGDARWSIRVPNGIYRVYVAGGDAKYTNSLYKIDVEGVRAVDKDPTKRKPFADGVVVVKVEDGALTVTSGAGAVNNKIGFIEIEQVPETSSARVEWTGEGAAASPVPRVDAAAVQVGNRLFVFGGFLNGEFEATKRVDIYNLDTGTWSSGRDLPGAAAATHAGVASDGHRFIYLVSGQPNSGFTPATRNAYRYDIKRNKWDRYAKLPSPRYGAAMVYRDGMLHLFGGNTADRVTTSARHWVSDTRAANPTWTERAPLPRGGDHLAGAVVNGTIYAIGGEHGHAGLDNHPPPTYLQHTDVYAYNASNDTWTRKADLPVGSSHFEGATLVIGHRIFTFGGFLDGGEPSGATRVYDTVADTWTTLTPLPDPRENAAAAYHNGRFFVTAGFSDRLGVTGQSYWGTLVGI